MYRIEGYEFETRELAQEARKELEGIRYIRQQTQMNDPQVVQSLYDKLILKEVFSTPIGYQFLFELQEFLKAAPSIKTEDIRPIPVYATEEQKQKEEDEKNSPGKKRQKDYRKAYLTSLFLLAACVMIIVGMFVITFLSGNNTNIINYENDLVNKYETWEEELREREAAVAQKEQELMITPDVGGEE